MGKILKAAEGRTVDQEDGTPWPTEGQLAPDTLFVRRRLLDGDLVEVDEPTAPEKLPVADVQPTKTKAKGGK